MNELSRALVHYANRAASFTDASVLLAKRVPGSDMLVRYIRSSYQNDPARSIIELFLFVFVIVYVAKSRFSTERSRVQLTEEEIDDLVADWIPEPLVRGLSEVEKGEKDKVPVIVG
jgi:hypothetical protein